MSLLDNFPHKCTIQTIKTTKDGKGGDFTTRTTKAELVSCWQQKASSSETREFGKRGIADVKSIYFNEDPNVTERDEILVTHVCSNGAPVTLTSPLKFEVISRPVPDASAGLGILYKVMVKHITGRDQ